MSGAEVPPPPPPNFPPATEMRIKKFDSKPILTGIGRRQRVGTSHARRRHRTPAQYVGQHGGALHVLDQQRDHRGQFVFAQRVAERASPVYVVNGRMGVLKTISFHV